MKQKTLFRGFLTVISISIILGCATSVPTPDKGKGTLVVIPLNHEIEHDFDVYYDYYVQINDMHTDKRVCSFKIPDYRNYVLLKSLDPGDYYVAGYKWRTNNSSGDLTKFHRSFSPFRVERGVVSFTPFGFGWYKGKTDDGKYRSRLNILRNDDGILHNEVLRELVANNPDEMALWDVPEISDSTIPEQIKTVLADAPPQPFELVFTDLLSGQEISVEKLQGKVVIIDFWATWCGPCVREVPKMIELYDTYRSKGVEFIGISLDEKGSTVVNFCEEKGMTWPQYCEEGHVWNTEFSQDWGVNSIPTLFILDRNGELYSTDARGKLDKLIPELLGEEEN